MPPSSRYRQHDYEFANTFVTLRTSIGLTQQGLAKLLGVSSRAVENWEQGLTSPKAQHLKTFLELCVRASAFAAGREEEQIRTFWRAARQKVRLDEHWLSELLSRPSPSSVGSHLEKAGRTGRQPPGRSRSGWYRTCVIPISLDATICSAIYSGSLHQEESSSPRTSIMPP